MDLKQLKIKRGALKSQITRLDNFRKSLQEPDASDIVELERRLEKIDPIYQEFNQIQDQIELLSLEDDQVPPSEDVERDAFETSYFSVTAKVRRIINESKSNSNEQVISATQLNNKIQHIEVKLPTINLPTFDGNYNNWLEFRDAFEELVDQNINLGDVQKMHYLKSALKGEAQLAIKNIKVTQNNYKIAWSLLQKRYENKSLIVYNHIKSIFDLQAMAKETHGELQNLFDGVQNNLRSLETLGQPVAHWDALIIYIIINKFDKRTRRDWEQRPNARELPTMANMSEFIQDKCDMLHKLENSKSSEQAVVRLDKRLVHLSTSKPSCFYCKNPMHSIYKCEEFLNLSIDERFQKVKTMKLCWNCLKPFHFSWKCKLSKCSRCKRPINSLLHQDCLENNVQVTNNSSSNEPANDQSGNVRQLFASDHSIKTLLSTVQLKIKDNNGNFHICRALVDNGSQTNIITNNMCAKLKLKKTQINFTIMGIGNIQKQVDYKVGLNIFSLNTNYKQFSQFLVLDKITDKIPSCSFDISKLQIPDYVTLADKNFNVNGDIDMLLGAHVFYDTLCTGQILLGKNLPILQNSKFGWIVAGNMNCESNQNKGSVNFARTDILDDQLTKFWEIEEVLSDKPNFSTEEQFCEDHFVKTFERHSDGRFQVTIPIRKELHLGKSNNISLHKFFQLEKRLIKNSELKHDYCNFINEYFQLNHMSKVSENIKSDSQEYFIPHFGIIKKSSLTTKLRVVFNASQKSDNNVSFNDLQFTGPTIQNDLFTILIQFRKHDFVLTGDISKMYRQVLINPDQRNFQKIFWRENLNDKLEVYKLKTLTYGTTSAPFLAIRCINQLAFENSIDYPQASKVILNNFYVDDLLTGSNSRTELLQLQNEITNILAKGCFQLRKWLSNDKAILNKIKLSDNLESNILEFGEENKTLGIFWHSKFDTIQYATSFDFDKIITKRAILSTTAKIFDPLGLVGPVVVIAKLILQSLWESKISWDDDVPQGIKLRWNNFCEDLKYLKEISIPRQSFCKQCTYIELHAFSDASIKAYGACVYVRSKGNDNIYKSNLLCAKSRVAPIKQISLPRLELSAALLMTKLVNKVQKSLDHDINKIYYYSDSTITLGWIQGNANQWKTFVANRVASIQRMSYIEQWHHVRTDDNPADLLTRGTTLQMLQDNNFWFEGPKWLKNEIIDVYSISKFNKIDLPEKRTIINLSITIPVLDIFNKFSSFYKLIRVFSYCYRLFTNYKNRKNKISKLSGPLSTVEINSTTINLIRLTQKQSFSKDYNSLIKGKPLNNKSILLNLNPFFDEEEIIRVGGRIQHSNFDHNKKHPILLPHKHTFTKLLMASEHLRLFHCGPQQLLYSIREKYWPIGGRNLAREVVHKCVQCFRAKPKSNQYLMGNLPNVRFDQFLPFHNVGVDYAGPVTLKEGSSRRPRLVKAYICLFTCLSTRAVHLELVSDLSSNASLNSLKRFIARRGRPAHMFSDNGTNFVGANSKLIELFKFIDSDFNNVSHALSNDGIQWHFIPAKSPHLGGSWESLIKRTKYHLHRVLSNSKLNFEEYSTVLSQIEAILNSRPLTPISSDPSDFSPLTPAHFIIGKSATSIPEPNYVNIEENRLKRYQYLTKLIQSFWKRWSLEYVSELQVRNKWKEKHKNLQVGSLVLLKEDNLPPLKWGLGRITKLFPGEDNVARVVEVRLPNGTTTRRSTMKLCQLPID